ncbi:hypothetical protein ABVT39_010489 [Epinephelus coioides]
MKVMEKNVMRLVAVQHLRAAYGIKTKNWNKNKAASFKSATSSSTKVFGVSLESLPYYNMECGSVPSFLVDACMILLAHVDTEGLFRKSGSVVRLKALRAKLDAGEECLSTALPCDVAGLLKQFFRELPEPVLPTELQEAFLKAQQLPTEEDRTSATMLLSCVLPEKNLSVLRYFFDFLHNVSKRSAENKMDSSNLSVILAPNILHTGDGTEKMNANTEKRLKLQAAIVHCFIENANNFGVLPQFLQEKVPAMMGCEAGALSPSHDGLEELDLNSGMKRRQRRSFGGSKYISKSEDNLLTPQCDSSAHRTSWSGETPLGAQAFSGGSFTETPMNMCLKNTYLSEPAIVSKPPAMASFPKKLCCASSAESLESEGCITEAQSQTGPTLLKIKKAFMESGSDLQAVIQEPCNSTGTDATKLPDIVLVPPPETPTVVSVEAEADSCPAQQSPLANEQNITFGQIEIAALSPLHIDSVIFESGEYRPSAVQADNVSVCAAPVSSHNSSVEQVNCSQLIEALDIQSPAHFKLGVPSGMQSTPYKLGRDLRHEFSTPPKIGTTVNAVHEENESSPDGGIAVQNQQQCSLENEKRRVLDHIHHFNRLTLRSPRCSNTKQIRSPLKFQRTPVRQTVRRINSLLGDSRRPATIGRSSQVVKAVSLESGLSPCPQLQPYHEDTQVELSNSVLPKKKPPPVPPRKPSTLARKSKVCALGDVTNKVQAKTKVDCFDSDLSGAPKPLVQQVVEKDMNYYRGSPKNPLNQVRLLSATKPVDL